MRLVCPACSAPFFPPADANQVPRCPNCGQEVTPEPPKRRPPDDRPAPEGRSRAVTVAALAHFLYAATNLCVGVSVLSVVGKSDDSSGLGYVVVFLGFFVLWAGIGFGVMARYEIARVLSMGLAGLNICLTLVAVAPANPVGAVFHLGIGLFILLTLLGRKAEFR